MRVICPVGDLKCPDPDLPCDRGWNRRTGWGHGRIAIRAHGDDGDGDGSRHRARRVRLDADGHRGSSVRRVRADDGRGFADFEVLATDAAGPDWYVELVDSSDTRVQAFGSTVSVSLDEASFTGQLSIDYNVYDDNFALVRASTLTVDVVPDSLVVEGGDTQVTLRWPGLPATVTGARISYGTGDVYSHDAEPGVTTVVKSGAAPWTINDLTNGSHYSFYVTPRIGSAEMSHGPTVYKTPRAGTNAPPVATDDTVTLLDDDRKFFSPTDNDTDADDDQLQVISHTPAAHGVLNCDRFGCDYDPTGTRQNDSFTYTVSDGYGGTDSGTVNLVARSATLVNDTATTPATKDKVIDVLANDLGIQGGDEVFVNSVSGGASAGVRPDRTVLFRAPTAGDYTFSYRVYTSDGEQLGTATRSDHRECSTADLGEPGLGRDRDGRRHDHPGRRERRHQPGELPARQRRHHGGRRARPRRGGGRL